MTHKECNGWTNYETWVVKLWIDNEEGSYNYWRDRVEEVLTDTDEDDTPEDRKQEAANQIAKELEAEHEEALPEVQGFVSDLLNAAMSEVNWDEIAEAMVNDLASDHPELLEVEKEEEPAED